MATSAESEPADGGKPIVPPPSEASALPMRVKLQATLGAERFVPWVAFTGILVCFFGLKLGPGRKNCGAVSAETSLLIGAGIGGGILLSAGLLWLLIDNHYVLDQRSRRILLHKGVRFFGLETPCWEAHDIIAVGLDCAPITSKGNQRGWSYTPVLLTRDSRTIQLASLRTNMECQKLPEYNRRTRLWAAALQCYWVECPACRAFRLGDYFGGFEAALNLNRAPT